MKRRSSSILQKPDWSNVRALFKSSGYTDDALEKPIIGIVNSFTSICPGHRNFRELSQQVREGIQSAGGTPVEFGTIAACDGMAMGHEGMRYILPTRELIANDIELMVEAHKLDAVVLLGSCDKIVPGMLMAAARLDIPALLLNGGPTLPGKLNKNNPYGGEYIDHSIIQESLGSLKSGRITEEEYLKLEEIAVPTIGSCAMLGTANTMCCLSEVIGMTLPGVATIPAVYSKRIAAAYETGKAIMKLVQNNTTSRKIITKKSLENAIMVNSAIGGSTNAVLHLLAIAYEAEIPLTLEEIGEISKKIPHMVPMIPAGKYTLLDFYEAGGVYGLMWELRDHLNSECLNGFGNKLFLQEAMNTNEKVINTYKSSIGKPGALAVLTGNLAPDGSISKPSAIPKASLKFKGPARVFENEIDAINELEKVLVGDVVVIRNEGPKGGPGMPEMYKFMKMLVGKKLGDKVAVITDGRFSGSNNGCFVGHIAPESLDLGPIAYLQDGDIISIDVVNGTLNVDSDLQGRKPTKYKRERRSRGYLNVYSKLVGSASNGAIIEND